MSSQQIPTPRLESFIEILSGISANAFLKAWDPRGSLELLDLRMEEACPDTCFAPGAIGLKFENHGSTSGFLVISPGADPPEGQSEANIQGTAAGFLRTFVEELAKAAATHLPQFRDCCMVDPAEAKSEMCLESGAGCLARYMATRADQQGQEILYFLSPSMCASVEQVAEKEAGGSAGHSLMPAMSAAAPPPRPSAPGNNIDLIMDIELGIIVSFGQTRMLLKDVMQLGTGSIVELDRMADEQVDLWVNNKRVARGEIVLVGSNYGVRVTEVEALAERINSLGV